MKEIEIVFVGRLHEQKGIIYLLEAFEKIKRKDVYLKIIGDDTNDYAKQLKRSFRNKRIKWLGFILDRKELASHLKTAYCIVLPSLFEGQPLTLFESLASKRPVIVSNIEAFQDIVSDKEVLFTKTGSSESIVTAINCLLYNYDIAQDYGKNGYEFVKNYDWDAISEETRRIYGI